MRWPFVTAARFADREREILGLRQELAETKARYERVIDEVNFRSTGFHLFERFDRKESEAPAIPVSQKQELEPTGVSAAINKVGRRPTAIRQYLESQAEGDMAQQQKEYLEKVPSVQVAAQLERALELGTEKAKSV